MELLHLIGGNNAIIFLLLFTRVSGVMAFFPFYSYGSIPVGIKALFAFFITLFLFPNAVLDIQNFSVATLALAVVSELFLGLVGGTILQVVFGALGLAGEQISFVMGFSLASSIDPMTGVNSPVIGRFIMLLALLVFLAFNGHHLILLFLSKSIGYINLGGFYPDISVWHYISKAVSNMFILGFVISFPIIALSLLSDVIFGMLMKTMPQFNLLVVGFPIKIAISFMVLTVILGSIMYIFKREFLEALQHLYILF
jgi:flagellar biosynthetic protein FliR